jgi:hypothetical protein
VTLSLYKNGADLAQALVVAKTYGCAIAKAFGITKFNSVRGKNWDIATSSASDHPVPQPTIKRWAKALGGTPLTVSCK